MWLLHYFCFSKCFITLTSIPFCLLSSVRTYIRAGDAIVPSREGCIRAASACRCGQTQSCHPSSTKGMYGHTYVCTCTLTIIVVELNCRWSYSCSIVCLYSILVILLQYLHSSYPFSFSFPVLPLFRLPFLTHAHTHTHTHTHALILIDFNQLLSINPQTIGKLSFIDLAGSERGSDLVHNNKQTRYFTTWSNSITWH